MLFEDISRDESAEEDAETPPSSRLPFLEAYWQDLLSGHQEAEPPAAEQHVVATAEHSRPGAYRELTAAS